MLRFIVDNLYAERKKKWFGYIKNESDSNLFHDEYTTNIQNFVFVFRLSFFLLVVSVSTTFSTHFFGLVYQRFGFVQFKLRFSTKVNDIYVFYFYCN